MVAFRSKNRFYKRVPRMVKSHWAQYRAEILGIETIEEDYGFICYAVLTDCIFIEDLWIVPAERFKNRGRMLVSKVEDIARAAEKPFLMLSTNIDLKNNPDNLASALAGGFIPFKAEANRVWLKRDVGV